MVIVIQDERIWWILTENQRGMNVQQDVVRSSVYRNLGGEDPALSLIYEGCVSANR